MPLLGVFLALLSFQIQAQSITDGLVAYWDFENDFEDYLGIYHGTPRGASPVEFMASDIPGFGQTILLDGVDQFVEITGGAPDDLAFAGGSMTVAGWFNVWLFDKDWQAVIAKGEGNSWRVARRANNSDLAFAGGIGDTGDSPDIYDFGWHHFAAVVDTTGASPGAYLYIDGALGASTPGAPVLGANGLRMMIGNNPGANTRFYTGQLDDVGIWDRPLTLEEIQTLYNGGTGTPIYSLLPAVIITTHPVSQLVRGGLTATFTAAVDSGTPNWQWQRAEPGSDEFVNIPGATDSSYTTPALTAADSGARYRAVASDGGATDTSTDAVLTVDAEAPVVESAGSLDGTTVGVCFSEPLDATTAENAANYTIAGATVNSATLFPHGMSVALDVTGPLTGSFTVEVANVTDVIGNPVEAGASATGDVGLAGFTAEDLVQTPGVDPLEPGSTVLCGPDEFDITAGGGDFWGSADRGHFLHRTVSGDFDVAVKVESLENKDTHTKAGLMARETMATGSRSIYVIVKPATSSSAVYEAGVRADTGGASAGWGSNPPVTYPNSWLRLKRTGDTFRGYRSTDGVNWEQFAFYQPATPFAQDLQMGPAVTSHNNNPGQTTVAHMSNFGLLEDPTPPAIAGIRQTTGDRLIVTWNEPVTDASAGLASNYTLDNGATISSATLGSDQQSVTIVTASPLMGGTAYTLTANNIQDRSTPANTGNNVQIGFRALGIQQGIAKSEIFTGITGTAVTSLTGAGKYQANAPDLITHLPVLNGPNGFGDNYGTRVTGWITPTVTGDYHFFVRSDDASQLSISSDADPANLTMVAQETDCCDAFVEPGVSNDNTATFPTTQTPIHMEAGQSYAYEYLQKEGGGGDWWQVAMRMVGDATPAADLQPISGNVLSALVDPNEAPSVNITSPSPGADLPADGDVTITATASDSDGSVTLVEFFVNGQKIGESTGPSYSVEWPDVPAGRYTLTARATDDLGSQSTSFGVSVGVGGAAKQILFALGDPAAINASDAAIIADLEALGFDVVVMDDIATATGDAYGKELVIVSSTVGSGDIGNKFQNVPVPVVNWEQALQDNFLFTLDSGIVRGEATTQDTIEIVDANHPLAAGLAAGPVVVTTSPTTFTWGVPGGDAQIVATISGNSSRAAIYGYDQGDTLISGAPAPARRVHIFSGNDTYAAANAEGKALFQAALEWALGGAPDPVDTPEITGITLSGGNITINYTPGATLQSATVVTGPYNDIEGETDGTYTTAATEDQQFFQAVMQQP